MKKLVSYWNRIIAGITLFTVSFALNAQIDNFEISIRNVAQTAQNVLEFDVYLLDKDPGQPFELASVQLGLLFNSLIYSGGTVTVTYDNTGSGLNSSQQFNSAVSIASSLSGYPNQTLIRLAGRTPPGAGNGTIISSTGDGTLVTHFRISSSVNFVSGTTPDLVFCPSTAANPLYPTRVSQYQGITNTALVVSPGTNAIVYDNPVLNPPPPTAFAVTGGGSYCEGGTGVAVGLSDSEIGVTYTLIRNSAELTPTVDGTGNPLDFGLQTVAGTYTVEGTNAGGTTTMTGSATVTVDPLPVAAGTITGTASVCQGETAVAYSVPVITNATTYEWIYTGTGATINGTTRSVTINFAANATSGNLTVRGVNSCGNGTVSPTYAITVNSVPVAAGTIAGTPTVCQGQNGVTYSVPAITGASSYIWAYSGNGATITGTSNSVTVDFASNATSGNMTVRGVNSCGNGAVSPYYAVTVNPLPSAAGTITGTATVCQGQSGVSYSVPAITGATSYSWAYSGLGATITGTTNSVTISFASNATSGNLTVRGVNSCGNGAVSPNYAIAVNPLPAAAGTITGSATVCQGATAVSYSVPVITNATTYEWIYTGTGATISGTTRSVTINFAANATSGNLTVRGVNSCGNGTVSANYPITVNSLPAAAGTITGSASVCRGTSSVAYSVPAIANATSYSWAYTGTGATISGTSNSVTISFNASATSGNLTVRGVNTCGDGAVSPNFAITVNALPTVNAGMDQTIPNGTSTNLSGTATGTGPFAYSWTPAAQVTSPTAINTATAILSSTTTFTLTATSTTTTCSNSDQVTVNVSGGALSASATATPNTVCAGTTVQLAANASGGSGSYTYVWTSNPAGFNSSSASPTVIPSVSTTYNVAVNDGFSTVNSQVSVTVNAIPAAPTVTVTQPTCAVATGTITVISPTSTGMTYSINGTTYTNTTGIFSGVAPGDYTVTARSPAGCTSPGRAVTVDDQPPTPSVSNQTASISSGGTFTVTPTGVPAGTTYTWPAPTYTNGVTGGTAQATGATSISGTLTIPTGSGTAVYTVTPTAGACVGNTFTVTVTVSSSCVPVTLSSHPTSASMCAGGNASMSVVAGGTSPFTYQWQYNNGATWVSVANGTPAGAVYTNTTSETLDISGITATGSYQYRCYITNCTGGNNATSNAATLTVNAIPDAPIVGTITQPTCTVSTGSVVLSGLPAGTWTINPGSRTGSTTTFTVTGLVPGSYTFTVTNSNGCTSPASTEVVINTQPAVPTRPVIGTVTQPTCVLSTGSVELSGLPSTGNWILRQYPGGIATTGSGTTATITSLTTGTYNFSVENEEGCISPLTDNVVINPQPATPSAPNIGSVTQPTYTVATGSVVLTGLPPGTWTLTRFPDNAEITASGTSHTIIGLEPGTYTFTVTNSVGCTSLPSANVVINPRPGTPNLFITNPPTICEDETVDLTLPAITAGSDADLTFTYWTDLMATEVYVTPTAATGGTYYIKGTNAQDFYAIKPVVVTADEIPVANAGLDQVLDYVFGTTLNAEIPEAGAGLWELVTGDGEIFNSTAPSTAVNGLALGENVFSWTVANGACDPVTDYIVVTVNNLIIPTLITPNQDGRNDFFVLRGLTTLGRTELAIFDRRGLKVYENTDYDNTWEGLDYNGYPLPEDTYFYVLRTANGISRSGYVVVRR
ncbi:MAG: gliding motility-associated C-terminal domain-containing protein [Bacteroidales bacterium]|nr:gliding motility-associated C-terminal domain-containing protein [Bacteroidales bacterium]MDT8375074.1 gliding motility-associated C-terminal domain-containing protein [Bacteroidales bacterium]